jgi:hypothetical protein
MVDNMIGVLEQSKFYYMYEHAKFKIGHTTLVKKWQKYYVTQINFFCAFYVYGR